MKKLVLIAASALFALGLCLGSAQAAEAPKGPKPVTNFGKKGVVTFDHAKHKDVKCKDCHHNEADGKYKCGECHGEKDGKAPKFEAAAHAKERMKNAILGHMQHAFEHGTDQPAIGAWTWPH